MREDITELQLSTSERREVVALPTGRFDAALLSMVLRALRAGDHKAMRRRMLRKAARCVRAGGVLVGHLDPIISYLY